MTLAALLPNCRVVLTDLPEAQEIVEQNISTLATDLRNGSSLSFAELDWDAELPASLPGFDLVLASDCTYNSDSRYVSHSSKHVPLD